LKKHHRLLAGLSFAIIAGCSHQERVETVITTLRFNQTPKEIDTLCASQQESLLKRIEEVAKTPESQANFANSVEALERVTAEFGDVVNPVLFLKYTSTDAEVRATADRCEMAVEKLFVDIFMREDLYKLVKAAKGKDKLEPRDQRLLDEYLTDFKRNGLELPPDRRKVFGDKKKELVALESEFSKNLVEWKDHLEVTEAQLEGLDKAYVDGLEKTDKGTYKISMSYPNYFPFMSEGKDGSVRKELQKKFDNRGGEKNRDLLERAIRLRHELAQMLGYKTHAHFVLEKRMAKDPETVKKFLSRLVKKLKPKGKADLEALLKLKREELKDPKIKEVYSYDWRYYENLYKKKYHQVEQQKIKEYFPLDVALKGMLEIYETLLGVKFELETNAVTWHPSVSCYQVKRDGKLISKFFMDLFPREGKYGHAAAFTLIGGYRRTDGTYQIPLSSIVANFNAPSESNPSLLTHDQVETLFHEFGHIMHQQLTQAKFPTYSGTRVKRDFVEAPSQMLENWVWEKESLGKLSGHYKDKTKKLPDELIQKLIAAKLANVGLNYLRQLTFATLDLEYHSSPTVDTTAVYKRLSKEIMMIPIQDGTMPQASFGHLMGGYDSGYYGYLWSEVYAQDMFTRFEKEGLLNSKTGGDYRKWVLEPGGEEDPFSLVRGFLGRDPNETAFLKSIGL
jgi:thimet oligopeptidase